nr:hypothetical protein [Tanacetum cinerariifolium]
MTLTFADTHNMTAYLTKSDASEGFDHIIDFLNASSIKYALTVVISEATIRDAIRLDDAEGRKFNFSKYIFNSLVRNVDSSTKFYMYPRFPQLMIKGQVGDLSSHTTKYSSPALTQKVFANMRRVEKWCSRVETPLFEGMLVAQQVDESVADLNDDDVPVASVADEGVAYVNVVLATVDEPSIPSPTPSTQPPPLSQDIPSTSQDKIAQALKITKLKQKVKKLERRNKLKASTLRRLKKVGTAQKVETSDDTVMDDVSKQGRMITDMDADVDVTLKDIAKDVAVGAETKKGAREVLEVVTIAKLITEVVTAASATITAAAPQLTTVAAPTLTTAPSAARRRKGIVIRDPEETATPYTIIYTEAKSKDKGKGILVEEPKPLKNQAKIEQDEAYARELEAELNKNIDWDEVIDHVQRKEKEDNVVKRYQALKRKPQTKAQARKNMMIYLRNMVGFKMDYFKGMTYDDIRPFFEKKFNSNVAFLQKTKEQIEEEDSRALKRLSETQEEKAAKKLKLDEEPKNFSDDFLLTTFTYMFEKPDVQAQVWKNQRIVHGLPKIKSWRLLESCGVHIITLTSTQMSLLVERRYPLSRFTLDQLINNVRLEVKEESEVSFELLSFGVDAAKDFKEIHQVIKTAGERLSVAKSN